LVVDEPRGYDSVRGKAFGMFLPRGLLFGAGRVQPGDRRFGRPAKLSNSAAAGHTLRQSNAELVVVRDIYRPPNAHEVQQRSAMARIAVSKGLATTN